MVGSVLVERDQQGSGGLVGAQMHSRRHGETEIQAEVPAEVHPQPDVALRGHDPAPVVDQRTLGRAEKTFLEIVSEAHQTARPDVQLEPEIGALGPQQGIVVGIGDAAAHIVRPARKQAVEIGAQGEDIRFGGVRGREEGRNSHTMRRLIESEQGALLPAQACAAEQHRRGGEQEFQGGSVHDTNIAKSLIFSYENAIFAMINVSKTCLRCQ